MMATRWTGGTVLVLALGVLLLPACKREGSSTTATQRPPVSAPAPAPVPRTDPGSVAFNVTGVELGKAVDAEKRISAPTTSFAPGDTIYASVRSVGAGPGVTLTARWSYQDGQVVEETSQVILPTGPAATEFHISKPDGWPTGRYKLEVTANGAPVATKEFAVQ
jgi:hypothetical protein